MPEKPTTPDAVAFRCKNCGRLEGAAHAGENDRPHACRVCDAGVRFGGDVGALAARVRAAKTDEEIKAVLDDAARAGGATKTLCPDNWEVLADAAPERLKELGLDAARVARHAGRAAAEGATPTRLHVASASDGPATQDSAGGGR